MAKRSHSNSTDVSSLLPPMDLGGGILALDIASNLGWCFGLPGSDPIMGSIALDKKSGNGGTGYSLMNWLANRITVFSPGLVLFEAPLPGGQHSSMQAGRLALGLAMVVEATCHFRSVACREENVKAVRKKVLGNGNASKAQVLAWCQERGWHPEDFDTADACAVWACGCLQERRS